MVLIPADIGVRMRMQAEASLQAITPAQAIPADLPELKTGQAFTARIQEVLPENIYRALVAGKSVTLTLPQGAQAGDTLELVVIDRTPRAIVAQLAAATSDAAAAEPYSNANLSPAGQLIGKLLLAKGEGAVAAPLSRGEPILAQPPRNGAELASKLNQAVTQSGLFYEAHQAKWLAGQLSASQLRLEPQGQQQPLVAPSRQPITGNQAASAQAGQPAQTPAKPEQLLQSRAALAPQISGADETYSPNRMLMQAGTAAPDAAGENVLAPREASQRTAAAPNASPSLAASSQLTTTLQSPFPLRSEASVATATSASPAQQIPDELRPLVQQQLDSVTTQRLAWHGEVWPGQKMDWQIEWEKEAARNDAESNQDSWSTRLSLTTPRLGKVDATLKLAGDGIRITLATPYGASAANLRDGSAALTKSLEAAGVHVLGLQVKLETK